jgi:hypothetical protein
MNKTQRRILKESFKGKLKEIGDADLDYTTTTKQAAKESDERIAAKINAHVGVGENEVPVVVSRGPDGFPVYTAGDKQTTDLINAQRGLDEASFDWADARLKKIGDKPFETMIDVPDARPAGLLPSDIGIMTTQVDSPTLSSFVTPEMDARMKRLWDVGFDGGFASGTKNLLGNLLGYGQAGKWQQKLRQSADAGETSGTKSKIGIWTNRRLADAVGTVANPVGVVGTAAGGAVAGNVLFGGKQEAETAANAKGEKLNREEQALAEKFGIDTDWTNPASYDRFTRNDELYDRQLMREAWADVRDSLDSGGKFARTMQTDAGQVMEKLLTAYGARLDKLQGEGGVFKRDSKGEPIKKKGKENDFERYNPLTVEQLRKAIQEKGLNIAGFTEQIGEDGRNQLGFKDVKGKRYVAVLQYDDEKSYQDIVKANDEATKAERSATNQKEKTPSNRNEAKEIQIARQKELPKRARWVYVGVEPDSKGTSGILRDKKGNPVSPEF